MKKHYALIWMISMIMTIIACALFTSCDTKSELNTETQAQTFRPIEFREAYPGEYEALCVGEGGMNTPVGFPNTFILQSPVKRIDIGYESNALIVLNSVCHPECDVNAYEVQVTTCDPDVIQIGEINKKALLTSQPESITLKAIKSGTAHVYIKLTHTPSGESVTMQQIIIVRDPAEATD